MMTISEKIDQLKRREAASKASVAELDAQLDRMEAQLERLRPKSKVSLLRKLAFWTDDVLRGSK